VHLGQVVQNRFLGFGQKAGQHRVPLRFGKALQRPGVVASDQHCQLKGEFPAQAADVDALEL
jgi:hypothetical protein